MKSSRCEVFDVLGIGFGPSNLALAIAIKEHNQSADNGGRVSCHFIERQQAFGWQRGMLIEGATMQVAFLKDLATIRNPSSKYSFINYLKQKERLVDFINRKVFFPSRIEFHDYLEWVANQFQSVVDYDTTVTEIRGVNTDGNTEYFELIGCKGDSGEKYVLARARNIVIATGLEAKLPPDVQLSTRILHNHKLTNLIEKIRGTDPKSFIVVGAGQSAAETTEYLYKTFDNAKIHVVMSRFGYTPSDNSPFVNRIFDPDSVDLFYHAPAETKRNIIRYHAGTNYSVVDMELIEELYRLEYDEKVDGHQRLKIYNVSSLVDFKERCDSGVDVEIKYLHTGKKVQISTDYLVFATGYRSSDPSRFLGQLNSSCIRGNDGLLSMERDYRIKMQPQVRAGLYLQGSTEHTHGISSTLLSNVAVRAGEILQSIIRHRQSQEWEKNFSLRMIGHD